MAILVVYESMFGNTKAVAEAIAAGLGTGDVTVCVAASAPRGDLSRFDLVVAGGPTHAWGLARPTTRRAAPQYVARSHGALTLEPEATGPGLLEWFADLGPQRGTAAAFDTRLKAPALVTGRGARRVVRELRRSGYTLLDVPRSFFVDRSNVLRPGELDRARRWGEELAARRARSALQTPGSPR